ncbi:MAG TPA: aminotransferase class I/II-fold pyridoxal phosphate-dependent enzyme [Gemmatimonadota bacterium]|nr:aminotransferase class I/II-fold pyridoxal phosphate-dependent enzyme [Gemmatimonadota bacterium]
MRELGYRVVDLVVEHLTRIRDEPAARRGARADLEAALREPIPEHGADPHDVIDRVMQDVLPWTARVDHPRFFAFVPGPGNYVGFLADALASGFNVFAGTWLGASGPAMVELVTVDWLRDLCGFPEGSGGLFVSGGSMANLTALAVARESRLGARLPDGVAYASDQTHSSVARALRVLGLSSGQLRLLASDGDFRLPVDGLARAIAEDRAAGRVPFCVIANAGTTNTGAVDPLPELADLCVAEGLWLHADAAYGGGAMLSPRGRRALSGLERADSLALDPHKWLFQPFEIGCVLVRDAGLMADVFHTRPDYMRDVHRVEEEVHFSDFGIQLSRSFRALKLWMSLQVFGLAAFRAAVEQGIDNAERAEARLVESGLWRIVSPARLGTVAFGWAPKGVADQKADEVTHGLAEASLADGWAFLSSTVLRGRPALRLCALNPRTTEADIVGTIDRLERLAAS